MTFQRRPASRRAFTLLEVMAVLAIVASAAAAIGLAWRRADSDRSAAVQAAQSQVAQLLEAARFQAELRGGRATIAVAADPAADGFLRRMFVLRESAETSAGWIANEASELLPAGVYCVPPANESAGVVVEGEGAGSAVPRSSLRRATEPELGGACLDGISRTYLVLVEPFASGDDGVDERQFVVAPGSHTPSGLRLRSTECWRAVKVNVYGVMLRADAMGALEE